MSETREGFKLVCTLPDGWRAIFFGGHVIAIHSVRPPRTCHVSHISHTPFEDWEQLSFEDNLSRRN